MAFSPDDAATVLNGDLVVLRRATEADLPRLLEIMTEPEVARRWGTYDHTRLRAEILGDEEVGFAVELDGTTIGMIQYGEELEPDYRHASIDIFIGSDWQTRGLGTDAVRTLARHLVRELGHHRLTIDPAADNAPAIASYKKVGFKPVGIMRNYERGLDGTWHDGLLMDLLAEELS